MKSKLRRIVKSSYLKAMGSSVDIMPLNNYSEFTQNVRIEENIENYWNNVGLYLNKGVELAEKNYL